MSWPENAMSLGYKTKPEKSFQIDVALSHHWEAENPAEVKLYETVRNVPKDGHND